MVRARQEEQWNTLVRLRESTWDCPSPLVHGRILVQGKLPDQRGEVSRAQLTWLALEKSSQRSTTISALMYSYHTRSGLFRNRRTQGTCRRQPRAEGLR